MKTSVLASVLLMIVFAVELRGQPLEQSEGSCQRPGEEYQSCGTACPETCDSRPQACTYQCVQGCFCKTDLVRNRQGECVPRDRCP